MSHLLLFYGSDLVFCLLIRNFSKEICSVTISRTTKSSFVWTTFCKTINGQKSDLFSVYAEIEMRTEKQKILATYFYLRVYLNTSLWISKCPSWFTKLTYIFISQGNFVRFHVFHRKTWLTENCNKCNMYMEKMHTTLTFLYAFWDKTTVPFFGLTYLKVANLHKISAN